MPFIFWTYRISRGNSGRSLERTGWQEILLMDSWSSACINMNNPIISTVNNWPAATTGYREESPYNHEKIHVEFLTMLSTGECSSSWLCTPLFSASKNCVSTHTLKFLADHVKKKMWTNRRRGRSLRFCVDSRTWNRRRRGLSLSLKDPSYLILNFCFCVSGARRRLKGRWLGHWRSCKRGVRSVKKKCKQS